MKANEAPEKIYLYPSDLAGIDYDEEWLLFPCGDNNIEYIRTDAFIDKACNWLKEIFSEYESLTDYNPTNDFKNYIKGE